MQSDSLDFKSTGRVVDLTFTPCFSALTISQPLKMSQSHLSLMSNSVGLQIYVVKTGYGPKEKGIIILPEKMENHRLWPISCFLLTQDSLW